MHQNKNQLYNQIKDIKTKEEFQKEISKRKKEYNDLLDEETIALMIVDELGRNDKCISKIDDLEEAKEATIFAKVNKIGELRTFNKRNGNKGRVVNITLSDETGTCNLVLWDKDVNLVTNKTIKIGSDIKVINGYIKNGFNGLDLNIGKYSLLELDPADMPEIKQNANNNILNIKGELLEKQPTRSFFKDSGEIGFVRNIKIKTEDDEINLTIWDKKVKEIQKIKTGDKIEISNFDLRDKNNKKEIHVNGHGVIKKL